MAEPKSLVQKMIEGSVYKVGDVVVTNVPISAFGPTNRRDGTAAPGWKWRIVRVYVDGSRLRYEVVSDAEPRYYHSDLRFAIIARKVGRHEGSDLYAKSQKPVAQKV